MRPTANAVGVAVLDKVSRGVPALVLVALAVLSHGGVPQLVPAGNWAVAVLTMSPVAVHAAVPVIATATLVPAGSTMLFSEMALVLPLAAVPVAAAETRPGPT